MQFAVMEIQTDSGGDATVVYALPSGAHFFYGARWIDGTLADGVDATLTAINTVDGVNQTLLTLTNANDDANYYPRATEHDATGTAGSGTTFPIFTGDLQLVVSSGGNAASGKMVVYYSE